MVTQWIAFTSALLSTIGSLSLIFALAKRRDFLLKSVDYALLAGYAVLQLGIIIPENSLYLAIAFGMPVFSDLTILWRFLISIGVLGVVLYTYRFIIARTNRISYPILLSFIGGISAGGVLVALHYDAKVEISRAIYYEPLAGAYVTGTAFGLVVFLGAIFSLFYFYPHREISPEYVPVAAHEFAAAIMLLASSLSIIGQRISGGIPLLPFNFFLLFWGLNNLILAYSLYKYEIFSRLAAPSKMIFLSIREKQTQKELVRIRKGNIPMEDDLLSLTLFGGGMVLSRASDSNRVSATFAGEFRQLIVADSKNLIALALIENGIGYNTLASLKWLIQDYFEQNRKFEEKEIMKALFKYIGDLLPMQNRKSDSVEITVFLEVREK